MKAPERNEAYMEYFRKREELRQEEIRKFILAHPKHIDYLTSRISNFAFVNGKLIIPFHVQRRLDNES